MCRWRLALTAARLRVRSISDVIPSLYRSKYIALASFFNRMNKWLGKSGTLALSSVSVGRCLPQASDLLCCRLVSTVESKESNMVRATRCGEAA